MFKFQKVNSFTMNLVYELVLEAGEATLRGGGEWCILSADTISLSPTTLVWIVLKSTSVGTVSL